VSYFECADESRARTASTFPSRWGAPPAGEEARASWIVAHVRADQGFPRRRVAAQQRVLQLLADRPAPPE
jgi:hypothetical protein